MSAGQGKTAHLAARQPLWQEPVAVVGSDFTLQWVGSGPIAPMVKRHALKRGSLLYAAPTAQAVVDLIAAGDRVTAAFRALGLDNSLVDRPRLARECEASIVAFDAALARAKGGAA